MKLMVVGVQVLPNSVLPPKKFVIFEVSLLYLSGLVALVLRIRIRMFLGLLDPDPLVRGLAPDTDPSSIKQK
jgi:hypothetical protein